MQYPGWWEEENAALIVTNVRYDSRGNALLERTVAKKLKQMISRIVLVIGFFFFCLEM